MTRLPDWEARLGAYLLDVRERPHAWGEHDCALHGATAAEAITGVDHGAPFRGRYRSPFGAQRALKRFGAGTIEATFDRHFTPIAPALAGRGDLVMHEGSIGVCIGGEALFVGAIGSDEGLVRVPRARGAARLWERAWRV